MNKLEDVLNELKKYEVLAFNGYNQTKIKCTLKNKETGTITNKNYTFSNVNKQGKVVKELRRKYYESN